MGADSLANQHTINSIHLYMSAQISYTSDLVNSLSLQIELGIAFQYIELIITHYLLVVHCYESNLLCLQPSHFTYGLLDPAFQSWAVCAHPTALSPIKEMYILMCNQFNLVCIHISVYINTLAFNTFDLHIPCEINSFFFFFFF